MLTCNKADNFHVCKNFAPKRWKKLEEQSKEENNFNDKIAILLLMLYIENHKFI